MKIPFSLNTDKEIIWSLPNSNVMLTMTNTSAEVELSELTDHQKITLANAINSGKITSLIEISDILDSVSSHNTSNKAQIRQPRPSNQFVDSEQLASKVKSILKGNIPSVKKEISNTSDIRTLKMMLAIEGAQRDRKSIVKILETKLKKIEEEVIQSINDESTPVDMSRYSASKQMVTYDNDVVELDQDTVQVDLSTGEIVSE